MLADGTKHGEIIKYCKKKGLSISVASRLRHNSRHRKPSSADIRKYATKKEIEKSAKKAKSQAENEALKLFTHSQFLKDVIVKVHEKLRLNTVSPTISDALKATELLQKIDSSQSPLEEAMCEFIMGLSVEHPN
jgi:DNA primase catalytic subunit